MKHHKVVVGLLVGSLVQGASAQVPICQVQGSGSASTYEGQVITTTGTVTAVYLGSGTLGGYFIEDPACDASTATSNGLFVYQPTASGIAVGRRVQVTGEVDEYQGLTELKNISNVVDLGQGSVPPTDLQLPMSSISEWERYEGMLLRFPQSLVVTDNSDWAQYGEVVLGAQLIIRPTDLVDPNDAVASGTSTSGSTNVAAVNAAADLNERSMVRLDDGRTNTYPAPLPLMGPEGTLRTGSTVTGLTAVLTYSFGAYRLEPAAVVPIVHAQRPAVPEVGGNVRVVGFNVWNYWTTLGEWGAQNSGELQRQRTKLVAALQALNADVYVLCELENQDAAWTDLLNALNGAVGTGTYACLEEDASGGGTRTVIFYRTAHVTPATQLYSLYTSTFQRPHLTQGFQVNGTGARFLVSSIHLRSKLCDNASGANTDQGDGQGCFNAQRRTQAQELAAQWAQVRQITGIQAHIMLGDLNSYAEEDPLDVLRAAGLQRLVQLGHTYQYGGEFGSLDHAFGTPELAGAVTGALPWAINSDEPPVLSYEEANLSHYQPNAFRCADHDPVLVGLNTEQLPVGMAEQEGVQVRVHRAEDQLLIGCMEAQCADRARVHLLDATGRVLAMTELSNGGAILPLQGLAEGVYFWRILSAGGAVAAGRVPLQRP